jgi:hypothetical protein
VWAEILTGPALEFVLGMSKLVFVFTSESMAVSVWSLCGLRLSAGDVLPVVLLVPGLFLVGPVVTGAGTAGGLLGSDPVLVVT